jgi:hypothetical protein
VPLRWDQLTLLLVAQADQLRLDLARLLMVLPAMYVSVWALQVEEALDSC